MVPHHLVNNNGGSLQVHISINHLFKTTYESNIAEKVSSVRITVHPIVTYRICPLCEETVFELLVFISYDRRHDFTISPISLKLPWIVSGTPVVYHSSTASSGQMDAQASTDTMICLWTISVHLRTLAAHLKETILFHAMGKGLLMMKEQLLNTMQQQPSSQVLQ